MGQPILAAAAVPGGCCSRPKPFLALFVPGALQHRQPRILRESRIVRREPAQVEDRTPIRADDASVPASEAQPHDSGVFVGIYNHKLRLFDRSSHIKNGPPHKAVITPTGISVGASTVRESVSHSARNAAPNRQEHGSSTRWSAPNRNRSACGTINPTNPM